ncbi:MAG: helix-turn-helix domain-containing protein [Gammaproteobacteria bacterium]|nr:helix-turn-helix domain-containing protein [Gammaproteobacteria bacterium]
MPKTPPIDLEQHFGEIWPVHVQHFTELLIRLRQGFAGDLDLMLILAIIGSRTLPCRRTSSFTLDEFIESRREPRPEPINLQSIAECSGIPRETVRRKLQQMEGLGWVSKDDQGHYAATAKASQDLVGQTQASLDYLKALFDAFARLADNRN